MSSSSTLHSTLTKIVLTGLFYLRLANVFFHEYSYLRSWCSEIKELQVHVYIIVSKSYFLSLNIVILSRVMHMHFTTSLTDFHASTLYWFRISVQSKSHYCLMKFLLGFFFFFWLDYTISFLLRLSFTCFDQKWLSISEFSNFRIRLFQTMIVKEVELCLLSIC